MKSFYTIPRTRLHRWNRRQRKKLRLGEFQQLGFTLALTFHTPLCEAAYVPLWNALIDQIERMDLSVGGMGGRLPIIQTEGFVFSTDGASVTPVQAQSLLDWCRSRHEVKDVRASELIDAWHGWEVV